MRILITGAAGNLGSFLARDFLGTSHELNLLIHRKSLPADLAAHPSVAVFRGDLGRIDTLAAPCRSVDAVFHFGGVLFKPRPEKFLPRTNVAFVENLVEAALHAEVGKIILVSFPHVEGSSTPEKPARGTFSGRPSSVHAQTRLAAEKYLFAACEGTATAAVALRPGMIYARGVLMIEAARWLMQRRLFAVWPGPTWIHLLALPDFLAACRAAAEKPGTQGIYNLGDDGRITLQEFADRLAAHWGYGKPPRFPAGTFYAAAAAVELYAALFGTVSPLTRDFVKIGMADYYGDTSRMKAELLPRLQYPTLREGLALL
ncbi:MAG: NAD(P)-dependent oxidoreductase [Candidatus Coatesbacteria bacterium]|nr:MAG: NAD(P)-dependent oxidoreductase [Candidatus Coatesbacteria bacterium]